MYAPATDIPSPSSSALPPSSPSIPSAVPPLLSPVTSLPSDVPPILSLLDRSTLRFLAAWSPSVLSPAAVPPAPVAVSGVAQPSGAVRREPSAASVSVPSSIINRSSSSVVSRPSSSVPSSSVPAPRTPHPAPQSFPSINLPLLSLRSGLSEPAVLTAFDLARAHDLIYPDGTLNPHVQDLLDSRNHRVTHFARRRRVLANRANSLKSTGPRTDEGKVITRLNALKCGLTAQLPVLASEHDHLYLALHQSLQDEYQPYGPTETILMDQLAQIAWRLRRAHLAEADLAAHYRDSDLPSPGEVILRAAEDHTLPKLDRHLTTLHRAFIRTLHELQELQSARHNAHSDNDIGQGGFVLKNDISPASVVPSSSAVSRPSSPSTPSTPSTVPAPSADPSGLPPPVLGHPFGPPPPPSPFSPTAPGARWPSLDDHQPIGPEALLLSVTDPRDKPAEDQT